MLERFFSLEATLGRRLVPFALVAVLGVASTALPPEPASWEVIAAAAAGLTIVSAVAFAIPWRRLPRWSWVLPALAFLAVVAALRHAHGGAVSGYAPLSLLPVVWAALYLRLREVLVVVTAAGLTVLLPALTDSAAYGSSEYRRALLLCAVALLVGTAIASFVGQQDRLAAAARAQAGELATSNRIITAMARLAHEHATDGALREAICAEACNALGASVATIVEPDRTGELHVTAASGSR